MIVECCDAVLQEALRLSRSTQHDAHSLHHDLHAAQKALAEERSRASALAQQLTLLKSADVSVSLWGGGARAAVCALVVLVLLQTLN